MGLTLFLLFIPTVLSNAQLQYLSPRGQQKDVQWLRLNLTI